MSGNVVEQIRQLGTRKGRLSAGRFVIEGARVVERALRASAEISHLVIGTSFAIDDRGAEIVALAKCANIEYTIIENEVAAELAGGRKLGAVFGIVVMPTQIGFETLQSVEAPIYLALIDIVEPGNVGAMIRTAHGLGVTAVLTCGRTDAWHPKAVRTAMGSLFKLPVRRFESAKVLLAALKEQGIRSVATVSGEGGDPGAVVYPDEGIALLMGNEFYGLSAEISAACDERVTIRMADGIDSFSVAASAAIVLYAVVAKRHLR